VPGLIESVAEQTFKRHPWLFLFIILTGGGLLGYSYQVFAEKVVVDVRFLKVETSIERIDRKIDLWALEQRLQMVESEIFQLERLESKREATPRDLERLDKMKIESGKVKRLYSIRSNRINRG